MRRLLSALAVTASVPVLLAVPVVSRPAGHPHPVAPHVSTIALAPTPARHGVLADSGARDTAQFGLVGATWTASPSAATARVEVRVHQRGQWSGWTTLSPADGGADASSPDARRAATVTHGDVVAEPVWVGASDGVQTRVVSATPAAAAVPDDLHVVLVDGGTSAADAHPEPVTPLGGDVAVAAQSQPTIYTRADWGADESLRKNACPSGPEYGSTILMGFVHHTDSANGYSRSQVPAIIRSIYAYHVESNGWCDIGYNYLVDRFGRIWEGRYGGITKPVIGAHTGGFNTNTFAASLIGNFASTAPSSAMLDAVERLFAWKLGMYYRDPIGKATLVAGYFSGSRYSTGSNATFNVVSGHRDADFTTCPGSAAYADLPGIRTAVRADMGAGFVRPSITPTSARMAAGKVAISSHVIGAQSWTATVTDATGKTVWTTSGTANRSTPVAATWKLVDTSGTAVQPGRYDVTLTGANAAGASARPYRVAVTVTPPVTVTAPRHVRLDRAVTASGTGRRSSQVDVKVVSGGVTTDLGNVTVDSTGVWSLGSVTVTAAHDLAWRVTDPVTGFVAKRHTYVAPNIVSPVSTSYVAAGAKATLHGTALPDNSATVTLHTQQVGATTSVTGSTGSVASNGNWSLSFAPTAPTNAWVTDARGLRSGSRLVYPVAPPAATAPSSGYAGRSVRVHGNAGNAPVTATLWSRQGSASWTKVAQTTAATSGAFAMSMPLPDAAGSTLSWKVTNGYGAAATGSVSVLATFAPTASGPARVRWNSTHDVTGTAVPGDIVTVWKRSVGTTSWSEVGSTKAASDKSWTFPLNVRSDMQWRVTSPSGRSAAITTVVVPTIHAPATATAGQAVTISGVAIPGQTLTLARKWAGTTTWTQVSTVTVAADGSWSVRRRPKRSAAWQATSHGQASRTVTISVS